MYCPQIVYVFNELNGITNGNEHEKIKFIGVNDFNYTISLKSEQSHRINWRDHEQSVNRMSDVKQSSQLNRFILYNVFGWAMKKMDRGRK